MRENTGSMCIQILKESLKNERCQMSKEKNKADETPIQFHIPFKGRPTPINQPNWIYKNISSSKPNVSEWISIVLILGMSIGTGTLLVLESMYKSFLWILVIALGIFGGLFARSAIIRTNIHTKNIQDDKDIPASRKRKKKQPKNR